MTTIDRSVNQACCLIYLCVAFTPNTCSGASMSESWSKIYRNALGTRRGLSEPWRKMDAKSFAPILRRRGAPPPPVPTGTPTPTPTSTPTSTPKEQVPKKQKRRRPGRHRRKIIHLTKTIMRASIHRQVLWFYQQ